jgi:AraC-like DNA-binding protein
MRQLRSVVGELLVALTSTLNDQRDSAQQSLRRAVGLLKTAELREASTAVKGGLAPWQIRKVASHVDAHLDQPIRSSELATTVRLSPCHFSRVFRTTFGESPLLYITRRRIEQAQRLMLATDAPLSQIALDCGFADQAHFSRLFRRIVGDTPRIWRRARVEPRAGESADGAPAAGSEARRELGGRACDRALVQTRGRPYGPVRVRPDVSAGAGFRGAAS